MKSWCIHTHVFTHLLGSSSKSNWHGAAMLLCTLGQMNVDVRKTWPSLAPWSSGFYGRPRPQDHLPRRSGPLRRHALVWFGGPFLLIGKAGFGFLGTTKLHFTKLGVADTSENLGQPLVSFVLNKNSFCWPKKHLVWRWFVASWIFPSHKVGQADHRWLRAPFGDPDHFSKFLGKHAAGWWSGTFSIVPYIVNSHPNWLIFSRGVETTNQAGFIPLFR